MTRRRIAFAVVLAVGLGALASFAFARPRGPALPQPRITSGPADPTRARSATFAFRGSRAGVTFECSLDRNPFSACTSSKTFAGPLPDGRHTFRVRAALGLLRSSADSESWRIDATPPPSPRILGGPPNPSSSRSATFRFTDAQRGVDYLCRLDGAAFRGCSSPRAFSGLAHGSHTFLVEARDDAGNVSSPASATWTLDIAAPPVPVIVGHPSDPSGSTAAQLTWTDSESGVGFQCRLRNDGDTGWQTCATPYDATAKTGKNRFDVRARDDAGNTSDAATFGWAVQVSESGVPFTIAGSAVGLLYPGKSVPVNLVLTNPNGVAITVTSVTVSIAGTSTSACPVVGNFSMASQLSGSVTVPANATRSLSDLGLPQSSWPQLTMASPPATQDGCQNATLNLAYSGSAHS